MYVMLVYYMYVIIDITYLWLSFSLTMQGVLVPVLTDGDGRYLVNALSKCIVGRELLILASPLGSSLDLFLATNAHEGQVPGDVQGVLQRGVASNRNRDGPRLQREKPNT